MKDLMSSVGCEPALMDSSVEYTSSERDAVTNKRSVTPETLPVTASSSSFEEVIAELENCAPSSVCQQRKLSAAIVTARPDASSHDFVAGRPTVTVDDLHQSASSSSAQSSSNHHHAANSANAPNKSAIILDTPPPKHPNRPVPNTCVPKQQRERANTANPDTGSLDAGSDHQRHHHHHPHPKGPMRQHSTPIYATKLSDFVNNPSPVRVDAWSEAPALSYNVRGPTYLRDRKKQPSEESLFSLLTLDLIQSADGRPIMNGLCNHPNERIQKALRREQETGTRELPEFIFAVNLVVPGPPVYHAVAYFGCDDIEALKTDDTPLGRITSKFFFGKSDDYRNNTFKLIPRIVDGNFVVKKAVGSKPSILGRKLQQYYIRHPRFFELIVDISSDSIARNVVGLSMGYARSIVVDMMFLLEATEEDTLPERILGGVRLKNLCFKKRDGQRKVQQYK